MISYPIEYATLFFISWCVSSAVLIAIIAWAFIEELLPRGFLIGYGIFALYVFTFCFQPWRIFS